MKWVFILVVLVVNTKAFAQVQPPPIDHHLKKQIGKIIRYDTDITWPPQEGAMVLVMDGGQLMYAPFGKFKELNPEEVWNQSYCLGGLSKTITAHALAVSPLSAAYKEMVLDSLLHQLGQDTTIDLQHILSHSTGLPRDPANLHLGQNTLDPYAHYGPEHFQEYLSGTHTQTDHYSYSHSNFILAGWLYEILSGKTVSDFWEKQGSSSGEPKAQGYNRAGQVVPVWNTGISTPSLGLWGTPSTLLQWLSLQMSLPMDYAGHQFVQATDIHPKMGCGHAWYILDYEKYPIILHSGKASGHSLFMGFVKETQTGVIVITNHQRGTEDLGLLVLRMVNKNWKRKRNGKKEK